MQNIKSSFTNPLILLKLSVNTIFSNPVLLYPLAILAFLQLLCLEIIFFAPRYPLVLFFEPMIVKMEGPALLHYPYNYLLLSKWFHFLQTPIYIFVTSLILGAVVWIVYLLNTGKSVEMRKVFQRARSTYIHLLVAALVIVIVLYAFSYGYGMILKSVLQIKATSGIFFAIKRSILLASPAGSLVLASFVTSLFAFVIPAIVIDEKKIFAALRVNFEKILPALGTIFLTVFLSGFIYFPILLIESTRMRGVTLSTPEMRGLLIVASIFFMLLIDALQYTAITIYYLMNKENSE